MPRANTIPFPQGAAKVITLAELQNCNAWKGAFRSRCKNHRYYEIVEETRSEEHTSELQSRGHLVCRLLLEKKNKSEIEKCDYRKIAPVQLKRCSNVNRMNRDY